MHIFYHIYSDYQIHFDKILHLIFLELVIFDFLLLIQNIHLYVLLVLC